MYSFELFKDKTGGFRFRFRASNGEVMFSSESYKAKASAVNAIESIKKNAPGATVKDGND
ncbi:YegP family protein [Agaricicola taiwanensis]|nr:YegP family protein [Agaricicola taiwanensis]